MKPALRFWALAAACVPMAAAFWLLRERDAQEFAESFNDELPELWSAYMCLPASWAHTFGGGIVGGEP